MKYMLSFLTYPKYKWFLRETHEMKHFFFNLITVSKKTYVNGFLGSFQTPNPHRPPYDKYVTYLTTYVGYIRRATKPTVSVPVMWNSFDDKCPITLSTLYVPIMLFSLWAKYVIFTKWKLSSRRGMSVLIITLEWHSLILTMFIIHVFSHFRDIRGEHPFLALGSDQTPDTNQTLPLEGSIQQENRKLFWIPSVIQVITKINSKSIQPITK